MKVIEETKLMCREFQRRQAGIEKRCAGKYFEYLIQRMSTCGGERCGHSPAELRESLSCDAAWMQFCSYRQILSSKKIGTFIVNALKNTNMPIEREARKSAVFRVGGLDMCYYCLLAWLGIPEGTARKYMCVLCVE